MIIDTSAVVAILQGEPETASFAAAIDGAATRSISAASYVECGIVLDRRDVVAARQLDRMLLDADIRVADLTAGQALIARQAYRDFGRGSGHPAELNYGDCFSYALAIDRDEPLLFKGGDFVHTDVRVALAEVTDQ